LFKCLKQNQWTHVFAHAIDNAVYESRKILGFANLDSWGYLAGLIAACARGAGTASILSLIA